MKLPDEARIHLVFHCSLLKAFKGPPDQIHRVALPKQFMENQPIITPLAILDYRRSSEQAPWEVLVQWDGLSPDETSWEQWEQLWEDYHLEDKVIFQGATNVTSKDATKQQTEGKTPNREVQTARKEKKVITRPSYLSDYV